ncbi:hypothetical protein LXL04_005419 [Taraxacum kok-saghyz]
MDFAVHIIHIIFKCIIDNETNSNQSADVKKQTVFFLQTGDVWSTSSSADVCRCGPQTADVLTLKKQTEP